MPFLFVVFAFSFFGIIALFAVKHWELRHDKILVPALRRRADIRAQQIKELAFAARADIAKLLPEIVRSGRLLTHASALALAALARLMERYAYRLADMVSHKRGFERRETRSEFLKKVAEHKEGRSE